MSTKFYRFYSEIRVFLSDLKRDPIGCSVSQYLKDRRLTKKKLIEDMLKFNILSRTEKIADNEENKPTYHVKYTINGKNFERKVRRLFTKYFEKNEPKKDIEECDCAGATSAASSGAFVGPLGKGTVIRKTAILNEHQFNAVLRKIMEATTCGTVGDFSYDSPKALELRTADGKIDPCYKR